jgi:ABC-type multidrug transport system ATPase subunit
MINNSSLNKAFKTQNQANTPLRNLFYLEDVSVDYGGNRGLSHVQFSVERGEIVFITGVSGAGKSTLLRVLAGEIEADSGRVKRPDSTVFVSQVFQDLRLMGTLTCRENLKICYDPSFYSSKKEFDKDLNELSRILGITDRLDIKIKNANGGLQQKIAIVRALLSRPDVIICDEPTSSLDSESARKIFEILNLYNVKRKLTVIWASHNRELVKQFSGRIVHLDSGKLVYSGHACFI